MGLHGSTSSAAVALDVWESVKAEYAVAEDARASTRSQLGSTTLPAPGAGAEDFKARKDALSGICSPMWQGAEERGV